MWLDYLLYLFGIVLKHTYWLCLCIWLPHSGNVNSPLFGLSVHPPVYEAKPLNRELPLSHFFRICYPFKWESQMASDGGVMCVVLGKLKKTLIWNKAYSIIYLKKKCTPDAERVRGLSGAFTSLCVFIDVPDLPFSTTFTNPFLM